MYHTFVTESGGRYAWSPIIIQLTTTELRLQLSRDHQRQPCIPLTSPHPKRSLALVSRVRAEAKRSRSTSTGCRGESVFKKVPTCCSCKLQTAVQPASQATSVLPVLTRTFEILRGASVGERVWAMRMTPRSRRD